MSRKCWLSWSVSMLLACTGENIEAMRDAAASAADAGPNDAAVVLFDASFVPIDASVGDATVQLTGCEPGLYRGTYSCEGGLLPDGPLEFLLEVDERVLDGGSCQEFCTDLVIKEGTGTLRGVWAVAGFEGQLQGGLDCQTGKFEARVMRGVWGLPPADPDGSVLAVDTFEATLQGSYDAQKPERITGSWHIKPNLSLDGCSGEISLQHQ